MPVFLTKQEWEILRVALSYFYRKGLTNLEQELRQDCAQAH